MKQLGRMCQNKYFFSHIPPLCTVKTQFCHILLFYLQVRHMDDDRKWSYAQWNYSY